jgi:putative SOS response-associated peptidase YedK
MCGRYLLHADPKLIKRAFGAEFSQIPRELVPRWNIAPTQIVPIVRSRPGRELKIVRQGEGRGRELATVRWGLIPAWAKDPTIGNRMTNARAEGITDKSAFRSRRCIVPASASTSGCDLKVAPVIVWHLSQWPDLLSHQQYPRR